MSRVHHLKSWPEPFAAMEEGRKTFDVRKDDRGFMVGDVICLHEWDPGLQPYASLDVEPGETKADRLYRKVTYVLYGGRFGLPEGLCVLGVEPCEEPGEKKA